MYNNINRVHALEVDILHIYQTCSEVGVPVSDQAGASRYRGRI